MRSLKKGPFLDRPLIKLAAEINTEIKKASEGKDSSLDSIMNT